MRGEPPSNRSEFLPRFAVFVAMSSWWLSTYYGVAWWTAGSPQASLETPFDAWIPFVPGTAFIYMTTYALILSPLVFARDMPELLRASRAGALLIGICSLFFLFYPVGAAGFRVPLEELDPGDLTHRALAFVYGYDPPQNLFPSEHVALGTCAVGALWPHAGRWRTVLVLWVLGVAFSACATRQHYVVDILAGGALGLGATSWLVSGATERRAGGCPAPGD